MTKEQAKKVEKFWKSGGKIVICSGPYVDGFAWLEDSNGQVMIRSEVWAEKPLVDESMSRLAFYREVPAHEVLK